MKMISTGQPKVKEILESKTNLIIVRYYENI